MKLDIFIKGELIDLCVPTPEFAQNSNWYSWFNDLQITRFLEQGLFPNTPQQQIEFLTNNPHRLILIVAHQQTYFGVVSLSSINFMKRTAEIAMALDKKLVKKYDRLFAIEAIARITEHGFATLGLQRISAGQHILLSGWQQRMELVGYRLEGIKRFGFTKGAERVDSMWIAATVEDYQKLVKLRGGSLWDSARKMAKRFQKLPKQSLLPELQEFQKTKGEKYYQKIFELQ
ncbi:TPA: hypothetical protein DIV55_04850 [Patescibacteria group bacterium]|uniref:N-acetyltransferase domain-containing protein n=1 Tax=Candidatus Gottesmanbacteria bacterium GW2011_GWA1_43_11 TaxID=1618436 RepID=A0A0G1CE61_9BACT|nr:MAG: hypothetical protein UV59_C0031G0009 [Candidatus Gottesmanbacteria bacterium GW2011_GWA1_43_11]HCS79037.1 hypothetical protein [Patescibacteria group bacterium]